MKDFNDMPFLVTDVVPNTDYTLLVSFIDGSQKRYDMSPLLTEGVFQRLQVLPFFMKAHADGTTVVWDEELDIAPEELYYNGTPVE